MRSGRLNQIVRLLRLELVEDEFGQEIKSWTEFGKVWAGIEKLKTAETFDEDQINSARLVTIIMRYRADVKVTSRIAHKDRAGIERIYEVIGEPVQSQGHGYVASQFECRMVVA